MELNFTPPQKFKAKINKKDQLNETVYFVEYQLIDPTEIRFFAGQTMMLTVAPDTRRAMSIASAPQNNKFIESVQDVAPMGLGSKWLLERNVGDDIELMAPLGRFVINKDNDHKKILVATGTGIAPFRSMLLDETSQSIKDDQVSLYWGLRHEKDIYLDQELTELASERDGFNYYLTLSRPEANWQGLSGYVQIHLFDNEKDLTNCDFYLCGNKRMIYDIGERLKKQGVSESQIHNDPYY